MSRYILLFFKNNCKISVSDHSGSRFFRPGSWIGVGGYGQTVKPGVNSASRRI